MYEIAYGSKYDRELTTTQISKLVRADIKRAIESGNAILTPGLKCSVRTAYFSGGSSIDIRITRCPFEFLNLDRIRHDVENPHTFVPEFQCPRYTDEARTLIERLEAILSAYNYDGSDIQSDYFNVNFYGHVTFDHDLERQAREDARVAIAETIERKEA